ncbi:MAG: SRPBCC family protein [Micromonosporaceae bacterium]
MRLEQSFTVPVPVPQAWGVLLDIERIAPCMPGATLTDYDGEKFGGVVKVKLGPISLAYRGTGHFVERDEPGRRVVIAASGQDSRGAGGANARVTAVLHDADGGSATQVDVVADLDIAGRAAQFGRGMIGDVTGKLIKQFADCLAQTIAAEGPAPAAAAAAVPAAVEAQPEPTQAAQPPQPPLAPQSPTPPIDAHPIAAAEPAFTEAPVPPPTAPPVPVPVTVPPPVAPPPQYVEPAPAPAPVPRPRPAEAEPIDLLAVTGAKGMARRALPYVIVVLLLVAALIVWLAVR